MPNDDVTEGEIVSVPDQGLLRPNPRDEMAYASSLANELAKVIETKKLYNVIKGRKHVRVEGWTTLAATRGCTPVEVSNDQDPNRPGVYVAVVELHNADGRVIGRASAECGEEVIWSQRDAYARRSMANTRATSKVCRMVFSWIMTMAGYEATPSEEMSR